MDCCRLEGARPSLILRTMLGSKYLLLLYKSTCRAPWVLGLIKQVPMLALASTLWPQGCGLHGCNF